MTLIWDCYTKQKNVSFVEFIKNLICNRNEDLYKNSTVKVTTKANFLVEEEKSIY